ncbi:hypothetical protein DL764_010828 [Monosporascus ibericus]|uniref:Uncharacterized protein n=1 Tax=Monosporascus ibericus TaxID=155417 RepID=A0A4Q4SS10_9PEZI|nr:hypothetical protein DL764_010828 [Monosporascus ibericus]
MYVSGKKSKATMKVETEMISITHSVQCQPNRWWEPTHADAIGAITGATSRYVGLPPPNFDSGPANCAPEPVPNTYMAMVKFPVVLPIPNSPLICVFTVASVAPAHACANISSERTAMSLECEVMGQSGVEGVVLPGSADAGLAVALLVRGRMITQSPVVTCLPRSAQGGQFYAGFHVRLDY